MAGKPVRRSVTLDSWGMYADGKKREEKLAERGKDLLTPKPERGSITGDPWGRVQSSIKKGGQTETAGGLGSQRAVDNVRP